MKVRTDLTILKAVLYEMIFLFLSQSFPSWNLLVALKLLNQTLEKIHKARDILFDIVINLIY